MYRTIGIIKQSNTTQKQGWYYLSLDDEISDYYKWFYSRAFKNWNRCLNGCHVTFISGEKEKYKFNWDWIACYMLNLLEKEIEVCYTDNTIYTNGRAFWINCESVQLNKIRNDLNLNQKSLHITLGNIKGNYNEKTY